MIVPALAVAGFAAFTAFLVLRLREGFDRRVADEAAETTEEPEDVVSRAIEFTLDEQGEPLLRVVAEEATGRSDGVQRFLGVSARFFETWEGGDSEIAADELLLDAAGGSLQFLGNARLTTEGLELGGPHLRFRRAPDQLWSNEIVHFATEDFFGVALSFRFHIETREVHLRGVAVVPPGGEGVSAVAESAVFDPETGDTTLFGEVELATDEVVLTSRENVVLRRDPELGRIVAVEAGFGSRLHLAARSREAAPGTAETPAAEEEGAEGAQEAPAPEEAVEGSGDVWPAWRFRSSTGTSSGSKSGRSGVRRTSRWNRARCSGRRAAPNSGATARNSISPNPARRGAGAGTRCASPEMCARKC